MYSDAKRMIILIMCILVCLCVHIYVFTHTHTHTHRLLGLFMYDPYLKQLNNKRNTQIKKYCHILLISSQMKSNVLITVSWPRSSRKSYKIRLHSTKTLTLKKYLLYIFSQLTVHVIHREHAFDFMSSQKFHFLFYFLFA